MKLAIAEKARMHAPANTDKRKMKVFLITVLVSKLKTTQNTRRLRSYRADYPYRYYMHYYICIEF